MLIEKEKKKRKVNTRNIGFLSVNWRESGRKSLSLNDEKESRVKDWTAPLILQALHECLNPEVSEIGLFAADEGS